MWYAVHVDRTLPRLAQADNQMHVVALWAGRLANRFNTQGPKNNATEPHPIVHTMTGND